ncbi:MAG TPA: hypothetical protein VLH08_09400 [Acidobacteriota bacterium]|nr:hypothetical protein [Acidobacteriota bacterium]
MTRGQRLDVFGDLIGDSLVVNQRLMDWQQEAASKAGLRIDFVKNLEQAIPPYFVMTEDVFFTQRYLNEFVKQAKIAGHNCRAGLAKSPLQDRLVLSHPAKHVEGGYCYDFHFVANNEKEEENILIASDDLQYSTIGLPKAISRSGSTVYCSTTMAILQIRSPLHLYQANMHRNLERAAERILGSSTNNQNKIGRNCSIHPTAVLEGCEVGNNVQIGAYAVLRYSTLGDGIRIADAVNMYRSVVGTNSQICEQHRVIMSVIYPECFLISGALQFSIIGYASGIFAAWITDARMDQKTIKTVVEGKVVDSGLHYLGCLMGHRAKVTAGVVTAPGRIIPNDTEVHLAPHLTYRGLPEDHPARSPFFVGDE